MGFTGSSEIDVNGLECGIIFVCELKQDSLLTAYFEKNTLTQSIPVILSVEDRPGLFDLFRRDVGTGGGRCDQELSVGLGVEEIEIGAGASRRLLLKIPTRSERQMTGLPSLG